MSGYAALAQQGAVASHTMRWLSLFRGRAFTAAAAQVAINNLQKMKDGGELGFTRIQEHMANQRKYVRREFVENFGPIRQWARCHFPPPGTSFPECVMTVNGRASALAGPNESEESFFSSMQGLVDRSGSPTAGNPDAHFDFELKMQQKVRHRVAIPIAEC